MGLGVHVVAPWSVADQACCRHVLTLSANAVLMQTSKTLNLQSLNKALFTGHHHGITP
jgi:hypothetical protein